MHPVLVHFEPFLLFGRWIGPVDIHSYGVLVAVGFALATILGIRWGRRDRLGPDVILDLAFWTLLAGLVGARLLYMAVNAPAYLDACLHPERPNPLNNGLPLSEPHCWAILRVWEGGLVWYGGLLGALLAGVIFLRRRGIPFAPAADIALGAVPLGHGFGRIGCFLAGCCWGAPTDGPLGVRFPADALPYAQGLAQAGQVVDAVPYPIHPTQLYEAAGEFLIFLILLAVRKRRRFPGQVALGFLILYPILRSVVELFRGDHSRGLLIAWTRTVTVNGVPLLRETGISTAQVISFLVVVGALAWTAALLKRAKASAASPKAAEAPPPGARESGPGTP